MALLASRTRTANPADRAGSPGTGGTRPAAFVAAAAALALGVIHLLLVGEYAEKQAYLGGLFAVGGVLLLVVAVALVLRPASVPAWAVGALVCAGMLGGGVLSRTTGLPGFHEAEWEPLLIVSILAELVFLACATAARRQARP